LDLHKYNPLFPNISYNNKSVTNIKDKSI